MQHARSRFYPLVDLDSLGARNIDPICFASRVLAVRPRWLQLRAKRASARETLRVLDQLLPLCRDAGTELFANDRPDLALLAGAAGVHVGQTDLPIAAVRRVAPELKIGVSTHDREQLLAALEQAPDYVAFGPVFATTSKERPDPVVGLTGLEEACALAKRRGIPLVAIGGITLERSVAVTRLGAYSAVIGALVDADLDEVGRRVAAFASACSES